LDKNGNTISTKARDSVSSDPGARDFPWIPKTFWEQMKGQLLSSSGELVDAETQLKSTTAFGIYFSAHWCGPCRKFTPVLTETYKKLKADGKKFEIVFVSADNSEAEFKEYFGHMPWTSIPFTDKKRIDALNQTFEVEGIPHFVLLDGSTGKVITKNARARIEMDTEGKEFPWHPKPLNTVDEGVADINESNCLVLLDAGLTDSDIKTLEKVAAEYSAKWKDKEAPLLFMYGKDTPMAARVKQFANLPEKSLLVLSIPDGTKTIQETHDVSEQGIKTFVEGFLSGSLKSKKLKE